MPPERSTGAGSAASCSSSASVWRTTSMVCPAPAESAAFGSRGVAATWGGCWTADPADRSRGAAAARSPGAARPCRWCHPCRRRPAPAAGGRPASAPGTRSVPRRWCRPAAGRRSAPTAGPQLRRVRAERGRARVQLRRRPTEPGGIRGDLVDATDEMQGAVGAVQQEPGPQPVDGGADRGGCGWVGAGGGQGENPVDRGGAVGRVTGQPGGVHDLERELVQPVECRDTETRDCARRARAATSAGTGTTRSGRS